MLLLELVTHRTARPQKVLWRLQITGDPRRPQEIRRYVPPKPPEDQAGDFRLVGAMMFGLAAMLTKVCTISVKVDARCRTYSQLELRQRL